LFYCKYGVILLQEVTLAYIAKVVIRQDLCAFREGADLLSIVVACMYWLCKLKYPAAVQVREFVGTVGIENMGKKLVNSKEKVGFEKPKMTLDILMVYGRQLVEEQENVKRVQLAEAYLSGAELAGSSGTSLPETFRSK
jgi:hypothetical protein